jgi:hypothetical protein
VILLSPVIQAARLNGPWHLPRYARPSKAAGRSVHVDWRDLEADYQFTPSDETKSFIAGQLKDRVTAIQEHWRAKFDAARGVPVAGTHHGDQAALRRASALGGLRALEAVELARDERARPGGSRRGATQ